MNLLRDRELRGTTLRSPRRPRGQPRGPHRGPGGGRTPRGPAGRVLRATAYAQHLRALSSISIYTASRHGMLSSWPGTPAGRALISHSLSCRKEWFQRGGGSRSTRSKQRTHFMHRPWPVARPGPGARDPAVVAAAATFSIQNGAAYIARHAPHRSVAIDG